MNIKYMKDNKIFIKKLYISFNSAIRYCYEIKNADICSDRIIPLKLRNEECDQFFIKNKTKLMKLSVETNNTVLSFKNEYDSLGSHHLEV